MSLKFPIPRNINYAKDVSDALDRRKAKMKIDIQDIVDAALRQYFNLKPLKEPKK